MNDDNELYLQFLIRIIQAYFANGNKHSSVRLRDFARNSTKDNLIKKF